jgi:hypothetical protein
MVYSFEKMSREIITQISKHISMFDW